MRKQYIFKCPITKYFIEYIVDTDTNCAHINMIFTDYQNIKAFIALVRKSIDQLSQLQVKKIRQVVDCIEWEMYLKGKTSWTIINTDLPTNSHDVECDIKEFLHNYATGIGMSEI